MMGRVKRALCYNRWGTYGHPWGYFRCPLSHQDQNWTYCCGYRWHEICCDYIAYYPIMPWWGWLIMCLPILIFILCLVGCYLYEQNRQQRQPNIIRVIRPAPVIHTVGAYPPGMGPPGTFQGPGGAFPPPTYSNTQAGFPPMPGPPGGPVYEPPNVN